MVDLNLNITAVTLREPNVSVKRQSSPFRVYKKIDTMLTRDNI